MSLILKQIDGVDVIDWARAISIRITDEWHCDSSEDKEILQIALENSLNNTPESIRMLIGTAVIEESYFDSLSNSKHE